ncbi:MAG: HlyD family type I secretion periplasmic adaptor subunit [Mailhella sp.]|nr:HlyD family type I secretion periplasmic adaptor subunit [Mailhella sp.]
MADSSEIRTGVPPVPPAAGAPAGMPAGIPGMPGQQPRPAQSLFEPASLASRNLLPEDLPYAAEVEAALARRPSRGSRWLSVAVFLFFASFVGWASVATLDEVTHAEGQVIASSRTQIIQNLEGGILRTVEVHEGQIVEKNDILARLDNETAESSLRDMSYKAMENMTAIRRLRAAVGGIPLEWPEQFREWLEKGAGCTLTEEQIAQGRRLTEVQKETYEVQLRQRRSELDVLESQAEQRRQEVKEQRTRREHLTKSLGLIRQQMSIAAPLLEKRSYSRVQYLELQERVVQTQGEIETLNVSIPRAEAAAAEAEHRISLRKAELDSGLIDEINKRSLELASLRESLSAGSDRVTRTELRSPVRGTVKQIYITTVGGVVKPGESIMEIVPLDDTLLVEARVRPADVAFLHPGQKAMVKVTAYDYSIYGGLEGLLEQISADTIEDKRGEYYYQVKIRTSENAIVYHGESLPIMPGMMTTADIMTGKKTVLDYLLKPILKAKQNALREK